MDDISSTISEFLKNPDAAEKLKSMAMSLMGDENNNTHQAPGDDDFGDIDVGKIMSIVKLIKHNSCDERANLLLALKPHLSCERRERVDKAVKILKLVSLVPVFREQGLLNL